jgi:hypothetical protein
MSTANAITATSNQVIVDCFREDAMPHTIHGLVTENVGGSDEDPTANAVALGRSALTEVSGEDAECMQALGRFEESTRDEHIDECRLPKRHNEFCEAVEILTKLLFVPWLSASSVPLPPAHLSVRICAWDVDRLSFLETTGYSSRNAESTGNHCICYTWILYVRDGRHELHFSEGANECPDIREGSPAETIPNRIHGCRDYSLMIPADTLPEELISLLLNEWADVEANGGHGSSAWDNSL